MKFLIYKIIFFLLLGNFLLYSQASGKIINDSEKEKYQAIVLGKITESKVKNVGNYYITEYRLKPKKWLFKNPSVKKSNYLTIKILGAELREKGIVIKASTAPDYVPIKKDTIFLLENTKRKENNIFTISKNGILPVSKLKELKKEI